MCFMLYAGTSEQIPRKAWDRDAPDISVRSLQGKEEQIRAYFSEREVQNIGSTSSCGCDFPNAMFQNGAWPEIEYAERDEEEKKSDQFNRESLVELLRTIDEDWIELYGIWAGDCMETPVVREEVSVQNLLDPHFYFKERGFYKVVLRTSDSHSDQRA